MEGPFYRSAHTNQWRPCLPGLDTEQVGGEVGEARVIGMQEPGGWKDV